MKVLFICRANAGRSQFAEAFYNKMTGTNDADSVGTQVDIPNELLEDRRKKGDAFAIDVMDELGIDMRLNRRTPLTEKMMSNYDLVVRIVKDEFSPQWLIDNKDVVSWDIKDPVGTNTDTVRIARDLVEEKVKELVG